MGDLVYTDNAAAGTSSQTQTLTITHQTSTLSLNGSQESASVADQKDPRKIARKYQMDLCKKALDENTIVYLGTGCGKTHIAVLLMYEMRCWIRKPQKDICVFLAPTVALVEQQARVIQESIDFKVGTYCGSSNRLKGHHDWEKELDQYEVFVMTPQILLHNLSHCFIRMELIALLIFDECHYAQMESSHPYAEIMKIFYKPDGTRCPRIFGMTASPKYGKGASISSLETLLHAKVYSVEDNEELEQFAASPKVSVYYYGTATNTSTWPHMHQSTKLEEIKQQCFSTLSTKTSDHTSLKSTKKALRRLHGNLVFCLENLGLWGALQACQILLKGDHFERNELIEAEGQGSNDALCGRYLAHAASVFTSECMKGGVEADLSCVETLKVPFFSWKLLRLIGVLSSFRLQPNMKCIIFVNRIITARSLSTILRKLKILSSWKCDYLVGVHSGLKSMSRKTTNGILAKFRSGELNLLVATKVGEEGLDIQTCNLVIRFDLPETVASFIQSRGRARMPQSEYAFLVDRENQKELNLIQNFQKDEAKMNDEIVSRTCDATTVNFEEKIYRVDSTGATISSGSSISLLHRYCSKLPHDEFFNPKPHFYYFDDVGGTICHIILPANAPLHQIVGSPQPSIELAKKDACLKACKELHEVGALSDFLLPGQDSENPVQDSSDSDCDDEENSRRELHEMLVPAALKESWTSMENTVYFNTYFIKFSPHPPDRVYRNFGLFVKAPIPGEANRMKLELQLARGRSVITELVPSGGAKFVDNEVTLAENFQSMCLKTILDRSDLTADTVLLGGNDFSYSRSSTFYLMLPVILHDGEDKMDVDWKLVRKCLSSPLFRTPEDAGDAGVSHLTNCLHLANGPKNIDDVVNSLVYAPCKDTFYFVSDIVGEQNGYSIYKESTNHIDHYANTFGIHLSYPHQPLLKAKQLFCLDNLLRKKGHTDPRDKEEHFVEIPPEICQLKILGFSKDIGSSLSLLPSIMHRLENLLVAIELKHRLSASFPEGAEVTASRVLEALTTEKCNESFSLERLEVLGDAFLKFAVGRRLFLLHNSLDEGQLTGRRSNAVNNSNLFKQAVSSNLHVYVRDQPFEPCQYFALGRRCTVLCTEESKVKIHVSKENNHKIGLNAETRCSKCHHWLHKKTVADVVEALVGAFIVDSGFKAATAFLRWIGIQVDFKASQVANICSASTIFMPLSAQIEISALENLLGYQFRHKGLLLQAFVHPSYNNHCGGCYQRLEFLGDAVLDYLITSFLYSVYPNLKPGQLTDLRSLSVNNNSLADVAVKRCFNKFILCDSTSLCESMDKFANFISSSASEEGLVEAVPCPKALGDLVESSVGAILLDSGFNLDLVWKIMLSFLDPIMKFSRLQLNPKRELQELCQFYDWDLKFSSVKKDRKFLVEGKVEGEGVSSNARAVNISRKAAKRIVAEQIFLALKAKGYKTKTKSLEEVLKSSRKMEAKLIGYDESPMDIKPSLVSQFDELTVQEPSVFDGFQKVGPDIIEATESTKPNIRRVRQCTSLCEPLGYQSKVSAENSDCNGYSHTAGGSRKTSAKSNLHETCAANCWKPPLFECCQEKGPSHMKEFVFTALVEVEDASDVILEIVGDPRSKKKDAAEHAAEGALWYLKHLGYLEATK